MQAIVSVLHSLDIVRLWPALVSTLLMLAVRCYKWQRVLAAANIQASPRDAARSLFGGFALSLVTPGRTGEFGRCLFTAPSSRAQALLLTVFDRVLDGWAVATCIVLSLLVIKLRPVGIFALGCWLAVLPIILGLPSLIASLSELPWWKKKLPGESAAAARALLQIRTAPFAALSLASTALDLMTFYFALRAFLPVRLTTALATFPWIVMAGGLPVALGGLGVREAAARLLLARFAVPSAVAFDAALLLFVFSGFLPAAIGGVWLLCSRAAKADPKKPAQEQLEFREAAPAAGGARVHVEPEINPGAEWRDASLLR